MANRRASSWAFWKHRSFGASADARRSDEAAECVRVLSGHMIVVQGRLLAVPEDFVCVAVARVEAAVR